MFDWLTDPNAWLALLTLTVMEVVLGIDNVVFISILVQKLPEERRNAIRRAGLLLALVMRIGLLMAIEWIMSLQETLFTALGRDFSGRALILLAGGAFLVAKSTTEIHGEVEGSHEPTLAKSATNNAAMVLFQILVIDVVFSLDSVITAVGMVDDIPVMITGMLLSVVVMLFAAEPVGVFVGKHPTMKMLALAFLILIGVMLVAEGLGQHISKAYVYFAMAFSLLVEMLNLRARKKRAAAAEPTA